MINIKWKTKNNMKTRIDITLFCHHKNIELIYDGSWATKLKINFALDKNVSYLSTNDLRVCVFPMDIYVLNISRLVNLEDDILYGMKSYDCHVFMQIPIPLAYRDLLPKGIWIHS
jgi:hypothetical protein